MPTVSFRVAGSDLTSYFDKVKQKADELSSELLSNAKKEAETAKEQVKSIQEQIALLERKNRIGTMKNTSTAEAIRDRDLGNLNEWSTQKRASIIEQKKSGKISNEDLISQIGDLNDYVGQRQEKIEKQYQETVQRAKQESVERRLQLTLSRENLQAIKDSAKETVSAIKKGDLTITEAIETAQTEDEQLAARLAQEQLDKKKKPPKEDKKESIFGSIVSVDSFIKLINSISQFASTQNGFDLIKPASETAGRAIGGIIGGIIGSIIEPGGGTIAGAGIGSSIGGAIGNGAGEFTQRRAFAMQDYLASLNKYSAVTGVNKETFSMPDMSMYGIGAKDFIDLMRESARAASSNSRAEKYAQDVFYANKGYGIDQATSMNIIDFQKSGKENNKDLANLIGGILQRGNGTIFKNGDTTFLNEFLNKFSQLQKDLLRTQSTVPTGTTFDILSRFNSMGGQLSANDPRSLGIIENINNSLINPSGDNMKAAAFLALRKSNPNMNYFDLRKEMQKGLGSPSYLKSMLEFANSLGGDETMKKLNLANILGLDNNLDAVDTIYKNENKILGGKFSQDGLTNLIDGGFNMKNRAASNTTVLEKNTAEISNKLLGGWYDTLEAMQDSFAKAMQQVADGVNITTDSNGRMRMDVRQIKPATTKKPSDVKSLAKGMFTDWMDGKPY